jgi:hypothetical protein
MKEEFTIKTVAFASKSKRIDRYDFKKHNQITDILISRTKFGRPKDFIVVWSDYGVCGLDGPYVVYPELKRAMRKAGALDFFGRVKASALRTGEPTR